LLSARGGQIPQPTARMFFLRPQPAGARHPEMPTFHASQTLVFIHRG
jgi:hypothetical protein